MTPRTKQALILSTSLFTAAAAACDAPADASLEWRGLALGNGLSLNNGLALGNGLGLVNGLGLANGLNLNNGLSLTNGLALTNGLGLSNGVALVDSEEGRELLRYTVECALPPDTSVTIADSEGTEHTFDGLVGLAPEWETEACEEECQEWVSACLFARSNAYGESVMIELVADHPAIGMDITLPHQEGAFFGNLDGPGPRLFSCWGADVDQAVAQDRVCATDTKDCIIEAVGPCDEVCEEADGAFFECRAKGHTYENVITTYVQ
jgi:hypothetical protein